MPEQTELDLLAAAEYARLQKQLRTLQLVLRKLLDDKAKQLKKQNRMISVLQQEHQDLLVQINCLESGSHARKKSIAEKKLVRIQEQFVDQKKTLETEKTSLWELEGHIRKIEKEIESLRRIEVPDSCYKEAITKVQKSVVKLENRLDVVNKKYSDALTENSKLRDSIDHMLQDRTSFNEMWQSMVEQFNEGKKYIMELIDQSTLAFDQREELSTKLQSLKDRNENDKLMHIQEMREMQRRLEHDAKLQQFFDVKGQRRSNPELEQREFDKKQQQKEDFEQQLSEYNGIIQEIKRLYQEEDTNCLAAQFKRQEEENFALFSYVNELSHEVEMLNDSTQELNDEIERQKADQAEKEFKQKTEDIDYLTSQHLIIQSSTEDSVKSKKLVEVQLSKLLSGIEIIYSLIHCDNSPILNVLSAKTALSVHNVKLILGVVERRINLIISENVEDLSSKILAKKDRVPKFNIKETSKMKN
ncbi:coiled-coil domain-containing protein 63 [Episyrphus balteatus]|uniref:coiled-coil domain-containing protein 63 n=1 Tax=Episyrphus balteatus TaxID=286459 RepID=UPI0024855240|nr:coiled-coil domain-containing protein 63 [Episyrphus balteatus]